MSAKITFKIILWMFCGFLLIVVGVNLMPASGVPETYQPVITYLNKTWEWFKSPVSELNIGTLIAMFWTTAILASK